MARVYFPFQKLLIYYDIACNVEFNCECNTVLYMASSKHICLAPRSWLAASAMPPRYIKKNTLLRPRRNIVEALLDESSYSPHSIIGINEQTSPQGPEAL